jgi:hypothetical protein
VKRQGPFRTLIRESVFLIRTHKLYFLAPTIIFTLLIAGLYLKSGTALLITFIYAGV